MDALEHRPHSTQVLSLAPMIDKSDRDWRRIMRLITRHTLLYTEMITAPAIVHGNRQVLLEFDPMEKPLVLQLGWDEAGLLSEACRIGEDYGYNEINLNCGCPSEKVRQHNFGACLMSRPDHTARLVEAMARSTSLPVTVKCRIGIRSVTLGTSLESYSDLHTFVSTLGNAGCRKFTVHARIAILEGLSPKENRTVPPLRPDDVYRLKQDLPQYCIEVNGGYRSIAQIDHALTKVDAVMVGRQALDDPWMLARADSHWFGSTDPPPSRREVLEQTLPYILERSSHSVSLSRLLQPLFPLFTGRKGSRYWKRALTGLCRLDRTHLEQEFFRIMNSMDTDIINERPLQEPLPAVPLPNPHPLA